MTQPPSQQPMFGFNGVPPAAGAPFGFGNFSPAGPSRKRSAVDEGAFEGKRRRTNLANGFSGLSLAQQDARNFPAHAQDDGSDDESSRASSHEVSVEELEDPLSPVSSSSADSEATYRPFAHLRHKRKKKGPLQADDVVHPASPHLAPPQVAPPLGGNVDVQDMESPARKRVMEEDYPAPKRQRNDDMELDDVPSSKRRTQWYEPEKDRKCTARLP